MTQRALVVSLLALALAGCLSTQDQPFPLGDGDSVAARPGDYACLTIQERGAAKAERGRLIRLQSDRRTQYVFVAPDNSSAEPATLHRVADGVYLAAVAHAEGPGEDLYLAAVAADGASFRLYDPAEAAIAAAPALAKRSGATLAHTAFGDDLSGPIAAQRAFALAFAGDLENWRPTADCRLR
ncbi:MAG: hypothetical protein ABSF49_15670 [Roseiarcus sp.]|jgi:hypothetical protein|uniref:hypothetical protein n=1 Tax=Roseiarcus sp. TaxID=1969460 RepID=UPI003C1478D1